MSKKYTLKSHYKQNSISNFLIALIILITFVPLSTFAKTSENSSINRETKSFNKVDIEGNFLIKILKSTKNSIGIYGDKNIIPFVIINVLSDTLYIRMTSDTPLPENKPLEIEVFTPDIIKLTASDKTNSFVKEIDNQSFEVNLSGNTNTVITGTTQKLNISASGKSKLNTENLKLNTNNSIFVSLSGLSEIKVNNLKSELVKVNLMDLSSLTVSGTTRNLELNATGSAIFNGKELESINSVIKMDDCTESQINAKAKLTVYLYGFSMLKYIGSPKIKKEISINAKFNQLK